MTGTIVGNTARGIVVTTENQHWALSINTILTIFTIPGGCKDTISNIGDHLCWRRAAGIVLLHHQSVTSWQSLNANESKWESAFFGILHSSTSELCQGIYQGVIPAYSIIADNTNEYCSIQSVQIGCHIVYSII